MNSFKTRRTIVSNKSTDDQFNDRRTIVSNKSTDDQFNDRRTIVLDICNLIGYRSIGEVWINPISQTRILKIFVLFEKKGNNQYLKLERFIFNY